MSLSVAGASLREQRRSLAMWAASLVGLVAMYSATFPSIGANPSYQQVFDNLPRSMRALFGASGDITSGAGYLDVELLSLMGPALVLIFAVGLGVRAVAGEEEAGTLELLLTTPLSRTRVLLGKAVGMGLELGVLMLALAAAMLVGSAAAGMGIAAAGVMGTVVHLGLLGLVFGSLGLVTGAATGSVGVARATALLLAVVSYLVNALAALASWLRPVARLSPFHQYMAHDPIRHGLSASSVAIAVITVLCLLAAGCLLFDRRDIA